MPALLLTSAVNLSLLLYLSMFSFSTYKMGEGTMVTCLNLCKLIGSMLRMEKH
jgi:hypothetical protein